MDYEYANGYFDNKVYEKSAEEIDEEKRMEQAFTIAAEANKMLAEAKAAVAKVRAARGYYDPAGMKRHAGKKVRAAWTHTLTALTDGHPSRKAAAV